MGGGGEGVLSFHKTNPYIHKHQTQIFEELVHAVLPLLKEHIRLGHWDHSI